MALIVPSVVVFIILLLAVSGLANISLKGSNRKRERDKYHNPDSPAYDRQHQDLTRDVESYAEGLRKSLDRNAHPKGKR